jgi:hypothetical protein
MSISISSTLPVTPPAAANAAARPAPASSVQPTTNASADTVRLAESQQVYQLYDQGQRVSQIAANLSLTVSAVNSYLDINGSS